MEGREGKGREVAAGFLDVADAVGEGSGGEDGGGLECLGVRRAGPWAEGGGAGEGDGERAELGAGEIGGEFGVDLAATTGCGAEHGRVTAVVRDDFRESFREVGGGGFEKDIPVAGGAEMGSAGAERDPEGDEFGAGCGGCEDREGGAEAAGGDAHLVDGLGRASAGNLVGRVEHLFEQVAEDGCEACADGLVGGNGGRAGFSSVQGQAGGGEGAFGKA